MKYSIIHIDETVKSSKIRHSRPREAKLRRESRVYPTLDRLDSRFPIRVKDKLHEVIKKLEILTFCEAINRWWYRYGVQDWTMYPIGFESFPAGILSCYLNCLVSLSSAEYQIL